MCIFVIHVSLQCHYFCICLLFNITPTTGVYTYCHPLSLLAARPIYLLGNVLVRAREAGRSVTVRGLAERDVTADLATWTLAYSAQGSELGQIGRAHV